MEDGEINEQVSQVLRLMQRELGSQKGFVGVGALGSSVLGYATRKRHGTHDAPSDIDFALFYDSEVQPDVAAKLERIRALETERFFNKDTDGTLLPVHAPPPFRHDLNMTRLREVFADPGRDLGAQQEVLEALVSLSGLVVGPQVDRYRDLISMEIKKLHPDSRDELIHALIAWRMHREQTRDDDSGGIKIHNRMLSNVSEQERDAIVAKRADLWRERIKRVYNLD